MFLSSPRVDSIFSRENWFSPSVVLSLATQVLSSVTVLSNSCHSLTRVSTLATQSSATDLTFMYLSLRAATSSSASLWVVIFLAAESAASKTLRWSTQAFSKPWTFSARAEASSRLEGLLRPSVEVASALTSQGENSLMPVLYSAQNLTSSEYLSHSFFVFFLEVCDVLGDSVEFILELLGISGNLVSLREEFKFSGGVSLDDLKLGRNVLLQVHGSGHSVLGGHLVAGVLDVIQLIGGASHPGVNALQGTIKLIEIFAEVVNLVDLLLKLRNNHQLFAESLDFLFNQLLLVLRDGQGHDLNVVLDFIVQSHDTVLGLVEDLLSLGQIFKSRLEVKAFLNLLDLFQTLLNLNDDSVIVLGIANPGVLGVVQEGKSVLSFLLGVIPANLDSLNMSLQELGLVRVLQDLAALLNQILDN